MFAPFRVFYRKGGTQNLYGFYLFFTFAAFCILLVGISGCAPQRSAISSMFEDLPQRRLTVHKLTSSKEMVDTSFVRKIGRTNKRPLFIRRSPVISPVSFDSVSVDTDAETNHLRIKLDNHGKMAWFQACAEIREIQEFAVLIDGKFENLISAPVTEKMSECDVVNIPFPSWNEERLQTLAERIRRTMSD